MSTQLAPGPIPPSYQQAGLTQSDVNTISTALGTSVADLPPLGQLTDAQLLQIQTADPKVHQKVSSHLSSVSSPTLAEPKMKLDTARMTILIAELNQIIGELGVETGKEGIKITKEKKATKNKERATKMKEAREKMADAKKKEQEGKVWAWIGCAAAIVAAVVVCALTFGAAAPAAVACVCAVIGLMCALTSATVMVLEEDLDGDGMGEMESMMRDTCKAKNPDMSEEDIQKYMNETRMIITITVAVVGLGSGLVSAGSGAISAYKAYKAVKAGMKVAETAEKASKMATMAKAIKDTSKMQKAGMLLSAGAETTEGVAAVGSGVNQMEQAQAQKDATTAQADADKMTVWLKKLQSIMEQETDELMEIMEKLNKLAFTDPKAILESLNETYMQMAMDSGGVPA